MKKYYLDSNKSVNDLLKNIYDEKIIAIDTEFTRQKTYYPILCLIQIGVKDKLYAIDCLSDIDLKPIFDVILDDNIKKIFHSCSQDLQIFFNETSKLPKNIVDIQLMANFCGMGYNIGYSSLVKEMRNVEIDKKLQKSNWQKRPLTDEQVEYALLDVVYLKEIYYELEKKIFEKERQDWFIEDMNLIVQNVDFVNEKNLLRNFIKNIDKKYNSDDLSKIRDLLLWREKMAQKIDLPRQHFISDNNLFKILSNGEINLKIDEKDQLDLRNIINSPKNIDFNIDLEIRNPIMNEDQKELYKKAKSIVLKVSEDNNLREQFLISTPSLKNLILKKRDVKEMLSDWRYGLFGYELEKLIA